MSTVDFVSEHGIAHLHGSEGHYLASLPARITLGLLDLGALRARETYAGILAPDSPLRGLNGAAFGMFFATTWSTGGIGESAFEWRGHPLDSLQISLNTALALGGDPIRFACHFSFAGYPWVDGPDRAWLADIIDKGVRAGVFRGPNQGWDAVTELLRSRDDGPVVIGDSTGSREFPTPYLGGWFPPELGNDYRRLTEAQQEVWDERADAWYEVDPAERFRIAMGALRAHPDQGLQMRPETWTELFFGNGLTAFDLLAADRDERLDRAFKLAATAA
jgi:hypothetical protein